MRNDIDDILNSMFRGGKFRLGDKGEDSEKKGTAPQEPDPMDLGAALEAARQRQEQAGQAVAAAQEAGDSLSKSLGESIQELTRQAKAGHGRPGAAPAGGRGGPPGCRRQPGQPQGPGQRLRDRPPGGGEPGAGPGRVRDRADPGLKAALCGGEPPRRPPVPGRHFRGGGHRPPQRVGGAHRLPGAAGCAEEPQDRRPGPGGPTAPPGRNSCFSRTCTPP